MLYCLVWSKTTFNKKYATLPKKLLWLTLSAQMVKAKILVHSCCVKEINKALILLASVNLVVFVFTKLNRAVEGGGKEQVEYHGVTVKFQETRVAEKAEPWTSILWFWHSIFNASYSCI